MRSEWQRYLYSRRYNSGSGGNAVLYRYYYGTDGRVGYAEDVKNGTQWRYEYDSETGLYYLNNRYYDPAVGRFINADDYVSTGQGILGCNMFAYCLDNPVNMVDRDGRDAESLAIEWGTTMWWLNWVDGPLPVGDIIYWGGLGLLTIGVKIVGDCSMAQCTDPFYSKPGSTSKQSSSTISSNNGSATAPPDPGNNNNHNWQRKKEKYLEQQLKKQNTDPHTIKKEYLGNSARISRYDLYVDKGTGQVAIIEKATRRIIEITNYFPFQLRFGRNCTKKKLLARK